MSRTKFLLFAACLIPAAFQMPGAELQTRTLQEYNQYLAGVEKELDARIAAGKFLWAREMPERMRRVRGGEVVAENWKGDEPIEIHEGDINDFVGSVYVPGKSLEDVMAVVRDYANYQRLYQPEVTASRLLSRDGDEYRVYLKYLKKFVVAVGYDTEHEVEYSRVDEKRWQSRMRAVKVAELEKPGTPDEKALAEGTGNGFLWRLYSACHFEDAGDGVLMECRAISLSAPLPTALSWMRSTLQEIPKQSLAATLEATRKALQ